MTFRLNARFVKRTASLLAATLLAATASAQRPERPLLPLNTWQLPGYHAVDVSEAFSFPEGTAFDAAADVHMLDNGNLLVLNRGAKPFMEFDADGKLLRAFGPEGVFSRVHGIDVDEDGNMWVSDFIGHTVRKFDKDGKELLVLGTHGMAGEWNEAAGTELFNQPNETAIDSQGNIYVVQGHVAGEPRVLKFTADGKFIKQWGERGAGPGQLAVAHGIQIDADDNIYVADRENFRVAIFDTEGNFTGEWKFDAMVCGIYLHDDGFMYFTTGFDGEVAKADMEGKLIGSLGSPGEGNGQFGEAHYLVLDQDENIYVADVLRRLVQKFAKE
jgi:DNA-binding beta-propeller fold protein YncE